MSDQDIDFESILTSARKVSLKLTINFYFKKFYFFSQVQDEEKILSMMII